MLGNAFAAVGAWRLRRLVIGLAAVMVLALASVPAAAGEPVTDLPTRLSGFDTRPASLRSGGELRDTVAVRPGQARLVTVQHRRVGRGRYRNGDTVRTSPTGNAEIALRAPGSGHWQFRLVIAATGTSRRLMSPPRTVVVKGVAAPTRVSGFAIRRTAVRLGSALTDQLSVSPGGRRVVLVQAREPRTRRWVTQSTGRTARTGAFRAVLRPTGRGLWEFRLAVRATARARSLITATRQVLAVQATSGTSSGSGSAGGASGGPLGGSSTADGGPPPDTTAPGAISQLHAAVAGTTVTLTWANPGDRDLSGVRIRRAAGATPPTTEDAGVDVGLVRAPGTGTIDPGLDAQATYSYALFAYDNAGNHATAATATVTTDPPGTAAGLRVAVHNQPITRLTVGTMTAFDAGLSHAAAGRDLVSGRLDFGDGESETFTGASGPYDYWNTVHTYATAGTVTVRLTVTDSAGGTDTTATTMRVLDAPTASLHVTGAPATVEAPVTLAMAASTPPGAAITSYDVRFKGPEGFRLTGTGPPPPTQVAALTIPGTYTITLTVGDDAGARSEVVAVTLVVSP